MQYPSTLAEYIWKLKRNRSSYNIKWNVLHKIGRPKSNHNTCRLCNLEKIGIACAQGRIHRIKGQKEPESTGTT